MVKRLSTIEQVISELGGKDAVAELTKHTRRAKRTSASTVPMWMNRKAFPPKTYAVMKAALRQRGFDAPDSLWKMSVSP